MLGKYLLILATLFAFLSFAGWSEAGDKLPGAKSYTMVTADGTDAGSVVTNSTGDEIAYVPGNGDPFIIYTWNSVNRRYENAVRNDYFEFNLLPQKRWTHAFTTASGGDSGTFSDELGVIVVDPLPAGN